MDFLKFYFWSWEILFSSIIYLFFLKIEKRVEVVRLSYTRVCESAVWRGGGGLACFVFRKRVGEEGEREGRREREILIL